MTWSRLTKVEMTVPITPTDPPMKAAPAASDTSTRPSCGDEGGFRGMGVKGTSELRHSGAADRPRTAVQPLRTPPVLADVSGRVVAPL